ncbi:ATP-binding protein [Actinosynnema sp. NPDC059335]|uniref:ATP-binding protein n=1 Tax=Actinosynnema sp. NPDC059335 TaxID=3346804 RepID=UPI00366D2773
MRNTVTGRLGGVVQAGVVHGGVHLHAAPVRPAAATPRQLPAVPAAFVGRAAELAALDDAAGTVSAIAGVGGIGKTCLALVWAHRNLDRFPDGQLFVDLNGFSPAGRPTGPVDAVRGFLGALGVDPGALPPDLDALAALYRGLVAGRRMLVVLDNAATAEQVVPLLPGSPTCTVLVTGRTVLSSLIDRCGARHVPLGVPGREEARDLLTRRLGVPRVAPAPEATDDLVGLCGRHPLALAIMARHAAARPAVPLAELAVELRELGLEMLDHHTDPAASLPAVLSWSLRHLTDRQREAFALLGLAPGPDVDLPAAASLTGLPAREARAVLGALAEASLLDRQAHGRYRMHDLVRAYAATTACADVPEPVRRAALDRVVDHYRHTAHAADHLLYPYREPIRVDPPAPGCQVRSLPDRASALAWLDAHHPHLLAAQLLSAARHRHQAVWHLAWALHTFHWRRGHRVDELAVYRAAVHAADHLRDPAARALAHRRLGRAHAALGRHESGLAHLRHALALAEHHHDLVQQAATHHYLAWVWELRGDDRRALEHASRAFDLDRVAAHPVWQARALNQMGWYRARLGDHAGGRVQCGQALEVFRRHHDPDGEAATHDSLGYIAHRTGDHHRAVHHYRRALALFRALGDPVEAAETLNRLGHPLAALGQHHRARAVWRYAVELYRRLGRASEAELVLRQLRGLDACRAPATR